MPSPILEQARARLQAIAAERAALDKEERELRAMVAAAEGASTPLRVGESTASAAAIYLDPERNANAVPLLS